MTFLKCVVEYPLEAHFVHFPVLIDNEGLRLERCPYGFRDLWLKEEIQVLLLLAS